MAIAPHSIPRRILLATDLSPRCDRALDRAVSLARTWEATLVLVHALEDIEAVLRSQTPLPSWRRPADSAQLAKRRIARDIAASGMTSFEILVERGEPASVIAHAAEAQGIDLILTGVARDEMFGRFALGTTIERLLRKTTIPLLIVKNRVRGAYMNIVAATDFSDSSRHALLTAMRLFPDKAFNVFHGCEVPMAHMASRPAGYEDQCREAAAGEWTNFLQTLDIPDTRRWTLRPLIEYGRPGPLLREYVEEHEVDLVVLGTRGRGVIMDVLIGSVAKQILGEVSCDALVVRESPSTAQQTIEELSQHSPLDDQ